MSNVESSARISKDVLTELWFGFKHQLFGKLQTAFRNSGLQQKDIAARIGRDPATVTRCLKGQRDIDMRTMHDLARGMGYRLRIEMDRLDTLKPKLSNRERMPSPALGGPDPTPPPRQPQPIGA